MKLKCTIDSQTKTKGIFQQTEYVEQISGLTAGKIYTGQFIAVIDYWINSLSEDNYVFLTYNDNGEWEAYDPNLFEPISE